MGLRMILLRRRTDGRGRGKWKRTRTLGRRRITLPWYTLARKSHNLVPSIPSTSSLSCSITPVTHPSLPRIPTACANLLFRAISNCPISLFQQPLVLSTTSSAKALPGGIESIEAPNVDLLRRRKYTIMVSGQNDSHG